MNHHRTTARAGAAVLIAGALLLAGCGSDSDGAATSSDETTTEATTEAAAGAVEVTDVWARTSPMATTAGAAYMEITAAEDDALIGASVPDDIAGTVEIHETVMAEEDSDMSTETTMAEGDMSTETTMAEGDMGEGDMGDGAMTMQPVDRIELPAGETVSLEPGGYHIMLLDLVEPLETGDTFEITLTFENAGEQTVTAEVREA